MDSKLKYFDSRSPKRARRTLKPWWNEDLTSLFDQYRISEKLYLKCSYRIEKSRLLLDFRKKRKLFDKFYNKAKRQYKEDVKIGIAESETKNPREFWSKLKRLGRNNNKTELPSEVRLEDGSFTNNKKEVLNKWQNDFSNIYNAGDASGDADPNNFDINNNNNFENNDDLNNIITFEECKKVINLAKSGKAIGLDCLPNEVFKVQVMHFCIILIKPVLNEYKDIISTKTLFILQKKTFFPKWQILEPQKVN